MQKIQLLNTMLMKKRLTLLLTALVAMSLQTFATVSIKTYNESATFTSATNTDIKSGTITWDKATKTVTFDNVSIEITRSGEDFEIQGSGNVTIKLIGDNSIKSSSYTAFFHMVEGVVTITSDDGKGTLTCEGTHGIYVNYKAAELVIKKCKVTATGTSGGGINGDGWNKESFAKLTIDFADVIAKGTVGFSKYGSISWVDDLVVNDCFIKAPSGVSFRMLPIEIGGTTYSVGGITTDNETFTTEEIVFSRLSIDEFFPDANFRKYVKSYIDTDHSGYLNEAEMDAVNCIDFYWYSITNVKDLTGIELFSELKILNCSNNDLSSNGINLYGNPKLEELTMYGCKLADIDLTMLTELKHLDLGYNNLTTLNVSNNTKLTYLDYYANYSMTTSVDISMLTDLEFLNVSRTPNGTLDVSHNTKLTYLNCRQIGLTALNVSMLPNLQTLICDQNDIKELDLSSNTLLEDLNYAYNYHTTSLNISACTKLKKLQAHYCGLTELTLPSSTDLNEMDIYANEIHGTAMKALVESLPTVTSGNMKVISDWAYEENVITTTQVAAATAKGWTVLYKDGSSWKPYAGSAPGIAIDATNFPDDNFRAEIKKKKYDDDQDGFLSDEEIADTKLIEVNSLGISNLKGLEFFTSLKYLHCNYNNLTAIDVTPFADLEILYCVENQLTALDVTKNLALRDFCCRGNKLTELDVSKNSALLYLYCQENQLTALDVKSNPSLKILSCSSNLLTELDVTKNTELVTLDCYNNALTTLDLTKNAKLMNLDCSMNQLTALDLSKFAHTDMPWVYIFGNNIDETAMQALVESLPTVTDGCLYVIDSSYAGEKNVINTLQVALALTKGWAVMDFYTDDLYAGTVPTGIGSLTPNPSPMGEGSGYYTLDGRKLDGTPTTKGIYIHNGSKVVVK